MASPIASGSSNFAFLNPAGGPARDGGTSAGAGFSDVLRGQMRSNPADQTSPPSRSDAESTNRIPERPAARQPERATERGNQRDSAAPRERSQGEPESASAKTSEPTSSGTAESKTTAADNKATHPAASNTVAHGVKSPTSPADAVSDLTAAAKDTIPATAESELDGPQTVITPDAETESAAKVLAIADAAAANDLAGLPAVIAALLPELAAKHAATTNTTAASSAADDTDSVNLTAEMGLAGDTRNKSPQNPGGAKPKLDLAPAFNSTRAQPAAALQVKTEVPSAFAERATAALQPISGELHAGAQASVMHTLRQPGQLPATTPQLPVAIPAGQNGWADEVGTRVMWMIGRAESKAELVLTPPNLGKVEVSINLNGDQTTAQFVAATQAARDALEQAMPRLRELLAQSGISLGQTGVSTSGDQQGSGDEGARGGGRGSASAGMDAGEAGAAKTWVRQTEGLVDTFA